MSEPCLYLVDVFSLMFQVFHAIPSMTGTQGQPTNAVYGLTRDLLALRDQGPTHLICAMDSSGPGERNALYAEYKANRAEIPEDLAPQIPLIKELLAGLRIPAVESPGWEADDVIATYAAQAVAQGLDVVIVSSDKDLRQLIGPRVRMFNCRKGEFLDEAGLRKEWGIRPDQVVDYQSLVGDSVDNVPGVPKVGPKTARTLLETFETLDNVLASTDQVRGPKLQENLRTYADQARMSRELVRLKSDLSLPLGIDDARIADPDRASLYNLFQRLGFRRYAAMMKPETRESGDVSAEPDVHEVTADPLTEDFFANWRQCDQIELDPIIGGRSPRDRALQHLGMTAAGQTPLIFTDLEGAHAGHRDALLQFLSEFRGRLVISDAKPFWHALLRAERSPQASVVDTGILDYLLDAGARSHNLAAVAERHGTPLTDASAAGATGRARQLTMFDDDAATVAPAAVRDVSRRLRSLREVTESMESALQDDNLTALYRQVEGPLIGVLARMEFRGIAVDASELQRQSAALADRVSELTDEIHQLAGAEFNLDSPKQLADVLFNQLALPVIRKTRTGASTDQEVLERLAPLHPIPAKIIERRQLTKLKSTYVDALPALIHPQTGRIHGTFHQTVAATGRLSSSDPNLQNIPIRTAEGRQVRRAFHAGIPDWLLLCADYSQIELRILAHFSQDEALLSAFREGVDIHAAVAADVFQTPVADVTSEQRRVAKAVNFGVIYGQSPYGLAAALGIEQSDAAEFIDDYFRRYAGVAAFCDRVLEETARTGYARTILNRRRAITGIRRTSGIQRNLPERTAINTVIQGSAADLIKKAMIQVEHDVASSGLRAAMLMQIHDELVFETHPDDLEELSRRVTAGMQNALSLDVPLVVDVSAGANWLDKSAVT